MFYRKTCKEITQDWENYREPIKKAFVMSPGALAMRKDVEYEQIEKSIKLKLTNPFQKLMQLWISEENGEINYVVLTTIQKCEYSNNKTLCWYAFNRLKDVEEAEKDKAYLEGYQVLTEYALNENCVGIIGYTDLDYFKDRQKELKEWTSVVHRHLLYLPLTH